MLTNLEQRQLWEEQHLTREKEALELEKKPNLFAKECLPFIFEGARVLEIGSANGRDLRFFVREKRCQAMAVDFSENAIKQLMEAAKRDETIAFIQPLVSGAKELKIKSYGKFDFFYSRSSLHLSDQDLNEFLFRLNERLKVGAYLMIEGKTEEDYKVSRSKEISANLFEDIDGHQRRLWNEKNINNIVNKLGYKLISIKKTEEKWKGEKTNFISFIAQKI